MYRKLENNNCKIFLSADKIESTLRLQILNSVHQPMQFTMGVSENKLPFLDIMIHKVGNKIRRYIYLKPTDSK